MAVSGGDIMYFTLKWVLVYDVYIKKSSNLLAVAALSVIIH